MRLPITGNTVIMNDEDLLQELLQYPPERLNKTYYIVYTIHKQQRIPFWTKNTIVIKYYSHKTCNVANKTETTKVSFTHCKQITRF